MVQILGTKKPAIAVLLHVHFTVHKHPLPCPWSIYGLADDFVQCFAHTDFKMLFWFRVYSTLSEISIALETMRWPKNRKHMSWSQHFWKATWKELEHVLVLLVVGLLKPYLGKWSNLTTFWTGSNQQLALGPVVMSTKCLIYPHQKNQWNACYCILTLPETIAPENWCLVQMIHFLSRQFGPIFNGKIVVSFKLCAVFMEGCILGGSSQLV